MAKRGRPVTAVVLTDEERDTLQRWARRPKSAQALAQRCRIVLGCAAGKSNKEVAAELGVSQQMVCKWRGRFVANRLNGLADEPRPGAPRAIGDEQIEAVVVATLERQPQDATHWSRTSMAKESGLSKSTVGRIWKAFGLKPHLVDTFKISNDPQFIDKVRDVVGLYLDPPEKALVLCVDEKSQIQALDRSAPVLPMMPGLPERRTHDYLRHGITTLFAALDVATGQIYGSIHRRHRATEFKKFLTKLDSQIPAELDVHLICDNYATHKAPAVATWLDAHPRFHMHHTPTYASWLNQVERWFALLTDKKLRRGAHRSIQALEKDIRDWITNWNDNPKTLHLDQGRRRDPRTPQLISSTNSWRRTLGGCRPDLVDGDPQAGVVRRKCLGDPELLGVRLVLGPKRTVRAAVDVHRVDPGLAADDDDPGAVAVGVQVQAHPRMVLDVADLGRIRHRVDDDIRAVEVEPHQPRYGLTGFRHRRQPSVVIRFEPAGDLLREFDCHSANVVSRDDLELVR